MATRSMVRGAFGVCGAALAVACAGADTKSRPGIDDETGTTASAVTWSDGRPAFSIDCQLPGDCRNRAFALCRGGAYTVLKTDTMTDSRGMPERTTTVARCT